MKYILNKTLVLASIIQIFITVTSVNAESPPPSPNQQPYVTITIPGKMYLSYDERSGNRELLKLLSADDKKSIGDRKLFWHQYNFDQKYQGKNYRRIGHLVGISIGTIMNVYNRREMTLIKFDKDINSFLEEEYRPSKSFFALVKTTAHEAISLDTLQKVKRNHLNNDSSEQKKSSQTDEASLPIYRIKSEIMSENYVLAKLTNTSKRRIKRKFEKQFDPIIHAFDFRRGSRLLAKRPFFNQYSTYLNLRKLGSVSINVYDTVRKDFFFDDYDIFAVRPEDNNDLPFGVRPEYKFYIAVHNSATEKGSAISFGTNHKQRYFDKLLTGEYAKYVSKSTIKKELRKMDWQLKSNIDVKTIKKQVLARYRHKYKTDATTKSLAKSNISSNSKIDGKTLFDLLGSHYRRSEVDVVNNLIEFKLDKQTGLIKQFIVSPPFSFNLFGITPKDKRSKARKKLKKYFDEVIYFKKEDYILVLVNVGKYSEAIRMMFRYDSNKTNAKLKLIEISGDINSLSKQKLVNQGVEQVISTQALDRFHKNKSNPEYIHALFDGKCAECALAWNINKSTPRKIKIGDSSFDGYFQAGLLQKGTITNNNGSFTGWFEDAEASGEGLLEKNDGTKLHGFWDKGLLVGVINQKTAQGSYTGAVDKNKQPYGDAILETDEMYISGIYEKLQLHPNRFYYIQNKKTGLSIRAKFSKESIASLEGENWINSQWSSVAIAEGSVDKYSLGEKSKYKGDIVDSLPHGYGKISYDYNYLVGTFEKGKLIKGAGRITLPDDSQYVGALIANNVPHGKGTLRKNNVLFEGQFSNGILIKGKGHGVLTFNNKSKYEGDINVKGKAHGLGEVVFSNGSSVKGQFINNQFQGGEGNIKYSDGGRYIGKVDKKNRPHGEGKMKHANGSDAKGEFKDGKFLGGHGKLVGSKGYYKGSINAESLAHGRGRYTWKNGSYAKGDFKNNKFISGEGTIIDKGKGKYEGSLDRNFKPHGNGSYYFDNDSYYKAHFNHGSFSEAYGILRKGKSIYDGRLNNKLQPHGKGSWSIPQGKGRRKVAGIYKNGQLDRQATALSEQKKRISQRNSQEQKYNVDEDILIASIQKFAQSHGKSARFLWSSWSTLSSGQSIVTLKQPSRKNGELYGNFRLWIWQPLSENLGNICMQYEVKYYIHHTGILGTTAEEKTSKTDDFCPSWNSINTGRLVSLGFNTPNRNYSNKAIIRSAVRRDVFMIFMAD